MTVRQTVSFDGGVDGATIAVGGDIASVSGTPTYSAAGAIHGALALRADSITDAVRISNTGTATHSASVYVTVAAAVPSGAARVIQFTTAAFVLLGSIRFHSDGKIDIASTAAVRLVASSMSWAQGSSYRLDWQLDYSGTNPTLTVRIFTDTEGASPAETLGPITLATTSLMQTWHLGSLGGAAGEVIVVDTFRIADGLEWIGAFDPPAVPGTVTHAWLGAPAADGFRVRAKLAGATSVRLAVDTDAALGSPAYEVAQVPDSDGYVDFTVTGLPAATQHYYQLADTPLGGTESLIGVACRARTLPGETAGEFRFAFGACATNASTDPAAFDDVRSWDPDLFLHLGDFHYQNPTSASTSVHRGLLEAQIAGASGLAAMLRDVPTVYLRSDHDAGPGDNLDHSVEAPASIAAYEAVVPHPTLADARSPRHGLYFAFTVRRVRFVVLDIRNIDRSPGADAQSAAKTMLGATQEAWLATELDRDEAVTVIVSDVAWLGAASTSNGIDKWWSYANARAALGDLCDGRNVLLLHGDSHALGYASGVANPDGGFPVWCSAILHQVGGGRELDQFDAYWNNGGGDCRAYARVTVTDTGSAITLALSGWDAAAGVERLSTSVTFDAAVDPVLRAYRAGRPLGTWAAAAPVARWRAGIPIA